MVKPGETVLGIARRHGITLDRLLAMNEGLKADYVQAEQVINVPYLTPDEAAYYMQQNALGVKTPADAAKQPANADRKGQTTGQNTLQPAAAKTAVTQAPATPPAKYIEYKVKRKDTAYSLAKAHGITVEELMEANPELKEKGYKLKKGTVIKIPVKVMVMQPVFKGLTQVRVAVMLPFLGDGVEHTRSVEFYRGLLMGLETLKDKGVNITVDAYDEPAPDKSVAQLMQQVMALRPDVIIGPLYPTHFADVTAVSDKMTKVVVPFSSKVQQAYVRPQVFMVNTPATYENSLFTDLFMKQFPKQKRVLFMHAADGDKRAFCDELRGKLVGKKYEVTNFPLSASAAQMVATLAKQKAGEYLVMPDDASEETLRSMLPKVVELQKALPASTFSLVGYDKWVAASSGPLKAQMHEADTHLLTANYFYPYTTAATAFRNDYERWFKTGFGTCVPLMAPLGYDLARSFVGGMMEYGHDYPERPAGAAVMTEQPQLQTHFRFMPVGEGAGYVNAGVWMVRFKKDMSIVKLSAK